MRDPRPVLIYDSRCGFCRIWVNYWKQLTGDRIVYAASRDIGQRYPEISSEDFRRSVWLVFHGAERFNGAEAVFRLLAYGAGVTTPMRAYQGIPGFAALSDAAYRVVERHRSLFYWLTVGLWGERMEAAGNGATRSVVLRGLALVYLIAFLSLVPQIIALVGARGILPAREYLDTIRSQYGAVSYATFPTLAWLAWSDTFLYSMVWAGVIFALALLIGIVPMFATLVLYTLYLSIVTVGQVFLPFQWDTLLLEAGFAAILLTPFGTRPRYTNQTSCIGIWVFRFLIFRLMFESGLAKLLSGDPNWGALTALRRHYETQPLPTPSAWHVHHLPSRVHMLSTAGVLAVELIVPLLFLMPRRPRILGAWITIVFQLCIAATGNYTFFNLLTIVLCVSLFDDQHLRLFGIRGSPEGRGPLAHRIRKITAAGGGILIGLGGLQLLSSTGLSVFTEPMGAVDSRIGAFNIVNRYGLFAIMTTSRPEIIIEGSDDSETWKEYEFKFKPGDINRPLLWVAPHQPRVDWQMWFAALSDYQANPWFTKLAIRLLQGSPDVVISLFAKNPFPNQPPRYVRALLYDYRFSDTATYRATGAVWTRRLLGVYLPPVSVRE